MSYLSFGILQHRVDRENPDMAGLTNMFGKEIPLNLSLESLIAYGSQNISHFTNEVAWRNSITSIPEIAQNEGCAHSRT